MNAKEPTTSWWVGVPRGPGPDDWAASVQKANERMNGVESSSEKFNKQQTRAERGLPKET